MDESKHENSNSADIDVSHALHIIKKIPSQYYIFALLALIVAFGYYERAYHIDYPVIGYHNWKEAHYLTEARNFAREGFFKEGFFIPYYDIFQGDEGPNGEHVDSFPFASIIPALLFKIFGIKLFLARLSSIIFSIGTIILMYFVVRKLFGRDDIAITAAAITAINPLLIFFGRQVQLEPYALFFIMCSAYFFLGWLDEYRTKKLALATFFYSLGFLARYDHFTILVGFAFIFPWKKLLDKRFALEVLKGISPVLIAPAWMLYTKMLGWKLGTNIVGLGFQPSAVFELAWNESVKSFIRDNFTNLGITVALIGFVLLVILFISHRKNTAYWFLAGMCLSLIPWLIIAAPYLEGHAYHEYPFAPTIILLQSLAIITVGSTLRKIIRTPFTIPVVIILGLMLLYYGFGSYEGTQNALSRVWNTQFPGLDIAGDYIRTHGTRADKIMHSSGQGYGLMWHADRIGYKLPTDPAQIMKDEELGANWIFMYQWSFDRFQNVNFINYLSSNYSLEQIGFVPVQGGGGQPLFFLFKKGGTFNMSSINEFVRGKQLAVKNYEYTTGPYAVTYTQ